MGNITVLISYLQVSLRYCNTTFTKT